MQILFASIMQRSLQIVPIFRLFLKITVERLREMHLILFSVTFEVHIIFNHFDHEFKNSKIYVMIWWSSIDFRELQKLFYS